MSEISFNQVNPANFITIPFGILADFLPSDAEQLRGRVENAIMLAPMPVLLAADNTCPYSRSDDQTNAKDKIEEMADWRDNLASISECLNLLNYYVTYNNEVKSSPKLIDELLNLAYNEYTGMVEQTANVTKMRASSTTEALGYLAADLMSVDKTARWLMWNDLALRYQQRKMRFANEIIKVA